MRGSILNKLYRYFFGYYKLKIICGDINRLLTECARHGLFVWNVDKEDEITVSVFLYCQDLPKLEIILQRLKGNYIVEQTRSIKFDLFNLLKRKIFVSGFIFAFVIIFFLTGFITSATITGNETVSDEEIFSALEKSGFKVGMFKYGINPKEIQKKFMINFDKLSWIWIEINGTKANISVKERIPLPEMENKNNYCNCVASRDGVIVEIMPRMGKQVAHVGDVVKKGDILIGGIAETKSSSVRYMHADGIVIAKTWYEKSGVYHHTRVDRYLTGKKTNKYFINIGENKLPLVKTKEITYNKYDFEEEEKKFSLFSKIYLPISFTIETYYEIIEEDVLISDEEVVSTAEIALKNQLEKEIENNKDINIVSVNTEHKKLDDGNIYVKVLLECTENIAAHQSIETTELSEEY